MIIVKSVFRVQFPVVVEWSVSSGDIAAMVEDNFGVVGIVEHF
jgi:hypothetical protein